MADVQSSYTPRPPPASSGGGGSGHHSAHPSGVSSLAPAMQRAGLLSNAAGGGSGSANSNATNGTSGGGGSNATGGESTFHSSSSSGGGGSVSASPLDVALSSFYPGLLESMRLDGRMAKARGKVLASGSWKKILTFVIESAKTSSGGGGAVPLGSLGAVGLPTNSGGKRGSSSKDALPPSTASGIGPSTRGDVLRGFASGEEVYGLGGGYNPLAKERSSRGGGASKARFREPDTEEWAHWHGEEWKAWKEWRVREKERLVKLANGGMFIPQRDGPPGSGAPNQATNALASIGSAALQAAGVKAQRQGSGPVDAELLLATAQAKLKRDDLKSSMDMNHLDLNNPLDHIHTVRHAHAPNVAHGHGKASKQGRALLAAHNKLRTADVTFQREQKKRASELYRNIWIQQMKVMKSNRALAHYSEVWDRKLQGYKMTLERDAQGNRIRAFHSMTEDEKRRMIAAQQSGTPFGPDGTMDMLEHGGGGAGGDGDGSESGSGSEEGQEGDAQDADGTSGGGGSGGGGGGGGWNGGGPSLPSTIRKLQANNPHKHIYHGAMSARNFKHQQNQAMAELAAQGTLAAGSLSARAHASTSAPTSFEAMLSAGLSAQQAAFAQQQQQQQLQMQQQQSSSLASSSALLGGGGGGSLNGGGKPRAPNLFARAILALKNRKAVLAFDDREMSELKEIFDALARDGYSKITKASFKSIVAHNFAAAGTGPAVDRITLQAQQQVVPPSQPIYVDRTRMDPLLDRLWLAINSNGRNSNFLDFPDFCVMVGVALNGSVEDRAAFAFEVYDWDDDGVLDIHDLFVCLHLSLDEYFPRDFHLISSNLYEKMDAYERIWKRRQEKIMELAERERREGTKRQQQQRANGGGGESSRSHLGAAEDPSAAEDLHGSASVGSFGSSTSSAGSSIASLPYFHQELPVLHITKPEFIRLHMQALAAAGHDLGAIAANSHATNANHHHTHAGGAHAQQQQQQQQSQHGAAAFRAAGQNIIHGSTGGTGSTGTSAERSPSMDLIEMIPKAFFFPYRRSKGITAAAAAAAAAAASAAAAAAAGGGSAFGTSPSKEWMREREKEKERMMAQSGVGTSNGGGGQQLTDRSMKFGGDREEKASSSSGAPTGGNIHFPAPAPPSALRTGTTHPAAGGSTAQRGHHAHRKSAHFDPMLIEKLDLTQTMQQQQARTGSASRDGGYYGYPSGTHTPGGSTNIQSNASSSSTSGGSATGGHHPHPPSSVSSDVDQLLVKLRSSPSSRLSKSAFRKVFLAYLAQGPNHQFHALNPAQAALDIAEEEKVVDFLFYALDVGKTGALDGGYAAAMLSFVLKGDADQQLHFYHKLLDLDRDGQVAAKDLCLAHDLTQSYVLRTDLKVLLEVFSTKIEQVILNTRRSVLDFDERSRPHANPRDVLPEEQGIFVDAAGAGAGGKNGSGSGDPALAVSSLQPDQHQQLAHLQQHAHVGVTLEEFHDALLKFNPSLFLKLLKRVPYHRASRFQAAAVLPKGKAARAGHDHHKDAAGADASTGAAGNHAASGHPSGHPASAAAHPSSGFEELTHLHRSLMRELKVCTQVDFAKCFPDAANSNIGDQITTLRRSLEFQIDCQTETRVFYLANQFWNTNKPTTATTTSTTAPPVPAQQQQLTNLDSAYTAISRLVTRVPQVYVQWTLLQDGSKHTSIETAKFRKAATRYALVTKDERRKARFKMVATPGAIYAYGGFPRPKTGDVDRADLQHYGTPLRCLLLSVSGAQLNEEGLDDLDYIRVDPATGEKYLDQPTFFADLCAQVHMWLVGFVEMVELENARAIGGQASGGSGGGVTHTGTLGGAGGSISLSGSISKTGLLRVVRIGAGNFAAVPGMKEHQGNLIAFLLMHAFLFNLKRNSHVLQPTQTTTPTSQPATSSAAGGGGGVGGRYGHSKNASTTSTAYTARTDHESSTTPVPPPPTVAAAPPQVVSLYKNLAVIEFIFFDELACPIPMTKEPMPGPHGTTDASGDRRMCGGVELRFSRRDVLELTTHHTSHHHIGILNPTDSFALPGNEEGYTSLAAMMGNNTSLRLAQAWHFNAHLLHAPNYIPIPYDPSELELDDPASVREVRAILASDQSPNRWTFKQDDEEEPTTEGEAQGESEMDEGDDADGHGSQRDSDFGDSDFDREPA